MKLFRDSFKAITVVAITCIMVTNGYGQSKDPKQLISKLNEACGTWDKLYALNDVEFTYKYHYPEADIMDLSVERYIFEGEHSWAKYSVHQINVLKDKSGEAVQSYNGQTNTARMALDGEELTDPESVGGTQFLRKANYFWFVMMFKMSDPGIILEYLGEEMVKGVNYDKVKVAYESGQSGKEENDAYVLYINPETNLVDRFFFSLPAFGINDITLLMEVEYTEVKGVKLPLKRNIYMPGADGKLGEKPALVQTSSELKFNNGFAAADLGL